MKLHNKDLSPLGVIYVVSTLTAIVWMLGFGPVFYNDTPSYLEAYTNNLSQGRIDVFRTPLYPLLLGWSRDLFGAKFFPWIIMILQYILFLISIKYFHLSAERFLSPFWAIAITAFYAIYPTFGSWSNMLLTESIALSLSVILMHHCLRLALDKALWSTIPLAVFLLLAMALRPASIAYLPALAFFFFLLLFIREKRKSGLVGLVSVIVASCVLLVYSAAVKKETGVFTPSVVSIYNNYTIAKDYDYLDHEIDLAHTDVSITQEIVNQSIKHNRKGWLVGLGHRFYDAALTPATTSYTSLLFRIHPLFPINIGMVLMLLIVYTVIVLFSIIRREIPIGSILLLSISISIISLSITGAQYEWNRLILPAQPMVLIILARLLSKHRCKELI